MGFVNKKNTGCSYQTETKPSFKAFLRETGCDLYPIQHISYQKKPTAALQATGLVQ